MKNLFDDIPKWLAALIMTALSVSFVSFILLIGTKLYAVAGANTLLILIGLIAIYAVWYNYFSGGFGDES